MIIINVNHTEKNYPSNILPHYSSRKYYQTLNIRKRFNRMPKSKMMIDTLAQVNSGNLYNPSEIVSPINIVQSANKKESAIS